MIEKIREWLQTLLRILFPEEIVAQILQAEAKEETSAAGEDKDFPEMPEEERSQMSRTPVERRHILFSGRVQGVGFRYQAMYGARNQGLTGWVSNLSDGRVEMEVQGPAAVIDYVLQNLGNDRWIRIDAMESSLIPVVEGEHGFRVRGF